MTPGPTGRWADRWADLLIGLAVGSPVRAVVLGLLVLGAVGHFASWWLVAAIAAAAVADEARLAYELLRPFPLGRRRAAVLVASLLAALWAAGHWVSWWISAGAVVGASADRLRLALWSLRSRSRRPS